MSKFTRSSQRALTAVGSGSSVHLVSALPVGVRQLPYPHRLSKRATQRLKWLGYRKTPTVAPGALWAACRHYDIPRATLHRWTKRCDPGNLASLEARSSRPQTIRQRTGSTGEIAAVLALRQRYPHWGRRNAPSCLRAKGSCSPAR